MVSSSPIFTQPAGPVTGNVTLNFGQPIYAVQNSSGGGSDQTINTNYVLPINIGGTQVIDGMPTLPGMPQSSVSNGPGQTIYNGGYGPGSYPPPAPAPMTIYNTAPPPAPVPPPAPIIYQAPSYPPPAPMPTIPPIYPPPAPPPAPVPAPAPKSNLLPLLLLVILLVLKKKKKAKKPAPVPVPAPLPEPPQLPEEDPPVDTPPVRKPLPKAPLPKIITSPDTKVTQNDNGDVNIDQTNGNENNVAIVK